MLFDVETTYSELAAVKAIADWECQYAYVVLWKLVVNDIWQRVVTIGGDAKADYTVGFLSFEKISFWLSTSKKHLNPLLFHKSLYLAIIFRIFIVKVVLHLLSYNNVISHIVARQRTSFCVCNVKLALMEAANWTSTLTK